MAALKPMLASPATNVPSGPDKVIQPKFDGWRGILRKDANGVVTMHTRTGKGITSAPYLLAAAEGLPPSTILDGEIVDLGASAGKEWNRTQSILSKNAPHVPSPTDPALTYVVFDALEIKGESIMLEPLRARYRYLPLLVELMGDPNVRLVDEWPCDDKVEEVYETLIGQGFEGVVCKDLESAYSPGARGPAWVKIKPELEMDVEVTGTYPPSPGSKYEGNAVGGITFRATHPDGTTYDGRCAGMDDELRKALHEDAARFVGLVAEVAYAMVGEKGALRFPRFKRFRDPEDKAVSELPAEASTAKLMLLDRALEAEEERDELRIQVTSLRERLGALLGDSALDTPRSGLSASSARRTLTADPSPLGRATPAPKRASASAGKPKMRNFKAMKDDKFLQCLAELSTGIGDAHERAMAVEAAGGPTVSEHLAAARKDRTRRGI